MTSSPRLRPIPAPESDCPCGSGKTFRDCCGEVLEKGRHGKTAEEVMRARFTAHAIGDHEFLHRSCLETVERPYVDPGDAPGVAWTRLVVHAPQAERSPDLAHVDFSAYYTENGLEGVLHEKAEFVRRQGDWIYSRAVRIGPAPARSSHPKVGRNDPCPCGSGKKYKHCCL